MSVAEIATRASYAAFLLVEKRRLRAGTRPGDVQPQRMNRWREAIEQRSDAGTPRFFAALDAPAGMRALCSVAGPYARQARAARHAADLAKRHEFEFFGQRFSYGPEIDWHSDPVSGRPWPRVFHRDVPIHDARGIGDVKHVWELNRHQFLIDLGKAYWLFEDREAAACVYHIVRHWIARNPYGVGVNWSCALEPAFRVWSWLWAYHFCAGDPALDGDTRAQWLGSFYEHGHFLHRHLEYYASPYNHLIGEASALYALGVLFPEMPEAARWRRRGRRVLESRLGTEFHRDGGSVEQSTFYHHATLGFYILATVLGDANGDPFAPEVHATIERGLEFSMALMQPDGRVPAIGGADDGKCIRLEHLPLWDFRGFQAFGAVRYDRGDFRVAAGEFFEDALWLLGPEGHDRFHAIEPCVPPASHAMSASGYYVLRSAWSPDADYLCFDCGEQAAGLRRDEVPSAAHGHADCLSVVLWLRGRPVLVDPGFYCYNGDPDWEVHFRRTGAHNTARIDGRDQSQHLRKMAWSRVFAPRHEAWTAGEHGGAAGGSHDGYLRGGDGVVHRRAVWLHESGCCLICDQFAGAGRHEIEITYQLAPGTATMCEGSAVLFDTAELAWTGSTPIRARLRCGEAGPEGGWIAPSLGLRVPAPRVTLALAFRAPVTTCFTLVVPRGLEDPRRSVVPAADANRLALGARLHGGETDWFGMPAEPAATSARELIDALAVWRDAPRAVAPAAPMVEHCS